MVVTDEATRMALPSKLPELFGTLVRSIDMILSPTTTTTTLGPMQDPSSDNLLLVLLLHQGDNRFISFFIL